MDYTTSDGGVLVPAIAPLQLGGVFTVEHMRGGELIDTWQAPNIVTNEGLNHVLNVEFRGTTQISTWYVGLFEANYTPVSTVTAATITAASTECTAYDETVRQTYTTVAATAQVLTNTTSKATFTLNATKTIYGAFLVSSSAKSAVTGTLFAAAQFSASKPVVATDQLLVTYAITASSV